MQNGHNYFVYILSNERNTVLYIGMTNNLERRVYEHKHKLIDGFTKRYNVNKLVYFEHTENIESAILRKKQIKKWSRAKKDILIDTINSERRDLARDWS